MERNKKLELPTQPPQSTRLPHNICSRNREVLEIATTENSSLGQGLQIPKLRSRFLNNRVPMSVHFHLASYRNAENCSKPSVQL